MADVRRRSLGAALAIAAIVASIAPAVGAPDQRSPAPLPSASGLGATRPIERYRAALAALPPLKDMVFQYSESRTGPTRTLVELHRVYRRVDGAERNETIAVNGATVVPAIVHYSTRPVWPYDVRAFAVSSDEYDLMPIGPRLVNGKRAYGVSAVRTTTGDFSVTAVFLDETAWLPLRETYSVTGSGCTGTGSIDFGRAGGTWLPTATQVSCTVGDGGATFKESIAFSGYTFPPSLPPDIFGAAP
ncbi:MAG TPA: hypothetical protein VID24_10040 [Candidatus Eremiobacteraceae bacterium]